MEMWIYLPRVLFLATFGVPIVLCKGIKCSNAYHERMCAYGCCDINGTTGNTCCQAPTDEKASKFSFTILFYAVIVFTLVLLIVCSVVKCARSDRTRTDRPRPDGIHTHATAGRRPSERVVINSIDLILQENGNRSRNGQTYETELTDTNIGLLFKGPPTYEEVVKQGPLDLPPSYQEIDYSSSNALRLSRMQNQPSSRLK